MAELNVKVCLSLLLVLQTYHSEVFGWSRQQPWSYKSEEECLSYYANMTIQEGSWCPTMWDGLLCWPPSPYHSVALLPCPPSKGSHERARTAYKRCSPEGKWESVEAPSSSSPFFSSSSSGSQSGPSHQTAHPCIPPPSPQDGGQEDSSTSGGAVTAYRVSSKIEHRYAQTTVIATIMNTDTQPSQLKFKMTLPKTAFISSLVMEIDGTNFTSTVKEKSVATRSYQVAKERAKDAALVEQSGMQEFEVSANIVSRQVTFYIKYEELLRRVNGEFIQKIHIRPGTRIPEAEVDVHIHEQEPIRDYRILELPGQELHGNPGARVSEPLVHASEIKVRYKHIDPPNGSGKGVDGTFTIAYTLRNHVDGGKIQRVGDYFNHFISLDASERLPKIATHTVFAIDVSNSMGSGMLSQIKAAMKAIIKSMTANDSFEILAFSSDVASLGVFNGTDYHKALRRVKKLQPMSYSDLNTAYLQALKSADAYTGINSTITKQIVMITDGEPTHGILDPSVIRRNVLEANGNRYPIFGIGFGPDAHFNLLQQISSDSQAFARHLDVKKDLAKDLREFYLEISNPILTDLVISYPENEVDPASVVKIANSNFYSGGEVVAVGKVFPGVRNIHPWVTGVGQTGAMQLNMNRSDSMGVPSSESQMDDSVVVRLWAYLTVQHLLKQAEMNDDYPEVKRMLDQATQLALKFRFVTLVTSLVVRDATGEYEAEVFDEDSFHLPLSHPSIPSSPPHGPSDLQRPPRRQTIQRRPQSYVDRDPHFVVHSPGMSLPICFDYDAHDGAYINLIRDSTSGIMVNGETTTAVGRPKKTYITKLFLSFGKVNITLTPDHMEVDCVDDDGNLEVDRVTKSLWPFYKVNGKKYRKRIDNRNSKRTPRHPTVSQGQQVRHSDRASRLQSVPQQVTPPPLKSYPGGGLLTGVDDDGKTEEDHYVMNSIADDYIPHHNNRRFAHHGGLSRSNMHVQHTQSSRRLARKAIRVKNAERRRLQSDHGLCNFNSVWEEGVGKKYGDVMVILNKKNIIHIMVGDGEAHYVIVRSQQNGQRFLGFYLEDELAMSSKAHGLIGQFTSKVITISPPSSSSPPNDNSTSIELLVKRRNRGKRYRMSHVSGFLSKRRSVLTREAVECIEVGRQGKGLIDGRPKDYLVSCLQC